MPIYEYECSECGGIEEAFQKMSDAPLKECSKCKGKLKKLVSHSSFHLKGSGWYVTDYGSSKNGSKKNPGKSPAKKDNKVPKKVAKKEAASKE